MRVARQARRVHEDERGATVVLVGIVLLLLVGFTGFAVDGGTLYMQRRHMVGATDAAALAAAQSFANKEATCGSGEVPAQNKADEYIGANINPQNWARATTTLSHYQFPTPTSWWETNCAEQTVTVIYQTNTVQVFSHALGMSDRPVSARATAKWGAAGGGEFAPFSLNGAQLKACGIPPADPLNPPTTDCHLYLNNSPDFYGTSMWATIDLSPGGWNVSPTTHCSNPPPSSLTQWLNGGAPSLSLNMPDPTYSCTGSGADTSVFKPPSGRCEHDGQDELACFIGQTLLWPVNSPCANTIVDPVFGPIPHGQLNKDGLPACPPATPDKFDIVGFAKLKLIALWRGSGSEKANFMNPTSGCPEFARDPYPHKPNGDPDSNAWCLITRWVGYTTDGFEPGGGSDFGVSGVGLTG